MNDPFSRLVPPMVVLCLPLIAHAQAGRLDPADVEAAAPPLRYQSAFADYKPWQEIAPASWRAVNDKVRDAGTPGAGGHGGHAAPPASAAPPAPAPRASAPAMPAHGRHHMHGGKR